VHCPADTGHIFVGAGDGPCVIMMTGARRAGGIVYPVSELAQRHRAGVEREHRSAEEAYAPYGHDERTVYREGDLPSLGLAGERQAGGSS
jgi:hypothetical protein